MADTTKNLNTRWRFKGPLFTMPMAAATKIYEGALVGRDAAGRAVKGSDTDAVEIVGVAGEYVDNSAGAAGDLRINVETGVVEMAVTAAVTALGDAAIGREMYSDDDQTVGLASDTVSSRLVGWYQEVSQTGTGWAWVAIGLGIQGQLGDGLESVSAAGALRPDLFETLLSVTGTVAYTLPDGSRYGQRKRITCILAASTPVGTVTLSGAQAAYGTEATTWVFTAAGQSVTFEWTSTGWKLIAMQPAGSESLLTGATAKQLAMVHLVNLDAANTYVQPNGTFPGQRSTWIATAGANASTITGTFWDEDGSADGTTITVNAAADMAVLCWDGSRWIPEVLVSAPVT